MVIGFYATIAFMSNTEHLFFGLDFDPDSKEPLNFLETRLTDLSPLSAHEVEIDGVTYKTAEHAYQALRVNPEARDAVANARSAMDAWREGQKCKEKGEIIAGYVRRR